MVGVIHANSPLDAIQRFIGKIELGIIPNVLDTVVFVKDGAISMVYDLELKVKVPTGMTESDLARPVIEIRDFESQTLEHEIYTFGEENVIVPVGHSVDKAGIEGLAEDKIKEIFQEYDPHAKVEILSNNNVKVLVDEQYIASIIGRGGSNINEIQKLLKVHIDVVERVSENLSIESADVPFSFSESKNNMVLTVNSDHTFKRADIYANEKFISTARIGKKGQIKIPKNSDVARTLINHSSSQNDIQIYIKDF